MAPNFIRFLQNTEIFRKAYFVGKTVLRIYYTKYEHLNGIIYISRIYSKPFNKIFI